MKLDFSSIDKAAKTLEMGIRRAKENPDDEQLRDGVIQRFEYTVDLAWKFTQRVLQLSGVNENEFRTKRDLFRVAAGSGLLDSPTEWFGFYEARNETSHTYNKETAERVFSQALKFLPAVQDLINKLKERTKSF